MENAEIMKLLKSIETNLKNQKADLEAKMNSMEESITTNINKNINKKFEQLEIKNQELENKLCEQETRIDALERNIRRKNIVFFGLEEKEKSYIGLQKSILDLINNTMRVRCNDTEIECVRRLGKRGEKTRPVILTVTTMGKKLEILKNAKNLKETKYYIKEDYPQKILEKRKILQAEVEKERELGNRAVIKYDKIVKLGKLEPQGPQDKRHNKRNLSASPQEAASTSTARTTQTQPVKKNKRDMNSFVIRDPNINNALSFQNKHGQQNIDK